MMMELNKDLYNGKGPVSSWAYGPTSLDGSSATGQVSGQVSRPVNLGPVRAEVYGAGDEAAGDDAAGDDAAGDDAAGDDAAGDDAAGDDAAGDDAADADQAPGYPGLGQRGLVCVGCVGCIVSGSVVSGSVVSSSFVSRPVNLGPERAEACSEACMTASAVAT
ncbi:unnamed protein product [Arctogadus glacialis]